MTPQVRNIYLTERAEHLANAEAFKAKRDEELRKANALSVLLGEEESAPDLHEMLEAEAESAPQAVVDFLRQDPTRFFTPSEISAAIAKRRGRPNGKNFYTSIYVTCRRIAPDQIDEGQKNGVRAYKFKTD